MEFHPNTEWMARGDSRPTSTFSSVASRLQGKGQGKGKKISPIVSTPQKSQVQAKVAARAEEHGGEVGQRVAGFGGSRNAVFELTSQLADAAERMHSCQDRPNDVVM